MTPECWIAVADATGIEALRRTTKDEPDYQKLMDGRIEALIEHDVTLTEICTVIATLAPLDGAREFLDTLRSRVQVVLLSDTFDQFAPPLMEQLGQPTILCQSLTVVDDRIVAFEPRIDDPKRCAVNAFRSLNYKVYAAGDSFNDLSMIDAADGGFLFRAPAHIAADRSDLEAFEAYDDLLDGFARMMAAG